MKCETAGAKASADFSWKTKWKKHQTEVEVVFIGCWSVSVVDDHRGDACMTKAGDIASNAGRAREQLCSSLISSEN